MNTLAFCTIGFRNDPIEDILPKLGAIGYDAAEIFWSHLEGKADAELQSVRALSDEVGLPTLVISPYLCLTRGQENYRESVERAGVCINAAGILGASKIRTFTDVGPTGIGSDVATDEQWAAGIEGLKTITSMAPQLTFVLETHEKTLADTPGSTQGVLDAVAAPNLKLLVHPSSQGGFGGIEGFRRFAEVIDHMHLNNRTPAGDMTWVEQGVFDHRAFLREAVASGYSGSVSVEYCFPGATWPLAASAHDYLREALSQPAG